MSTENNTNKINETRKVCSYKLYTQDGKFTEMGSGKLTLLIDYSGRVNREIPITGLGMTMDGSSEIDEVLIPSRLMLNKELNINMYVSLKGGENKKNYISGLWAYPVNQKRLIITGEYRYSGKPFQNILPAPSSEFDDYYILLREDDTDGLEDTESISEYFDLKI